jgi:DNA adenine methylase
VANPIIPWIGGKRRLAKFILPLFPAHQSYVEPFCGAAALFFMKEPARAEVLNDVNGDLVNLYRVVQHHLEEFVRQFKWALSSRQIYRWMQITPGETLTDIQRAARFYYLQKLAFGGKVQGQSFGADPGRGPRLNLLRLEEDLSDAHLRLSRATIEHLDWAACMKKYDRPGTLFYCDPPYWQTEGYGVEFGFEQYERLAEIMLGLQGSAIVSLNDHPDIRRVFADFRIESTTLRHTVGGGVGVARGEIVIMSQPPTTQDLI